MLKNIPLMIVLSFVFCLGYMTKTAVTHAASPSVAIVAQSAVLGQVPSPPPPTAEVLAAFRNAGMSPVSEDLRAWVAEAGDLIDLWKGPNGNDGLIAYVPDNNDVFEDMRTDAADVTHAQVHDFMETLEAIDSAIGSGDHSKNIKALWVRFRESK